MPIGVLRMHVMDCIDEGVERLTLNITPGDSSLVEERGEDPDRVFGQARGSTTERGWRCCISVCVWSATRTGQERHISQF